MMNYICSGSPAKVKENAKPLHELSLQDVVQTWRKARREHFKQLAKTMTQEEIGEMYGITRQAVSQALRED